jgi:hydrogenase nickel incorporation protein HypB
MFRKADLVVLTKIDLLPHLRVNVSAIEDALARVMPSPSLLKVSATTGEGIDAWLAWLEHQRQAVLRRQAAIAHAHVHP